MNKRTRHDLFSLSVYNKLPVVLHRRLDTTLLTSYQYSSSSHPSVCIAPGLLRNTLPTTFSMKEYNRIQGVVYCNNAEVPNNRNKTILIVSILVLTCHRLARGDTLHIPQYLDHTPLPDRSFTNSTMKLPTIVITPLNIDAVTNPPDRATRTPLIGVPIKAPNATQNMPIPMYVPMSRESLGIWAKQADSMETTAPEVKP